MKKAYLTVTAVFLLSACQQTVIEQGQINAISSASSENASVAQHSIAPSDLSFSPLDTSSLTMLWTDPWRDVEFHPTDCLKSSALKKDSKDVAAKKIMGSGATIFSEEGSCSLSDGSTWISATVGRFPDDLNPVGILMLLDKTGNLIKHLSSSCVSGDYGSCDFLGMKDENFFFKVFGGDGGGSNGRIYVTTSTGSNIVLEETEDWLDGNVEPLSPGSPPCTGREITTAETASLEKYYSDLSERYGHHESQKIQTGNVCEISTTKIIFYVTDLGEKWVGAIRLENSKENISSLKLSKDSDFPQFIKPEKDAPQGRLRLASRHVDNVGHNFNASVIFVNTTQGEYPIIDTENSHSIKANPDECRKIRCINLFVPEHEGSE